MKKSLRPAASLRVKKLEVKRPLQVYRAAEIPDLDEAFAQRAVPQIETGVDKEEEGEHHLQAAISAAQAESAQAAPIYIPTPDASRLIGNYLLLYRHATFNPLNFVRFSSTVEDCIGIPYCVDEEDERWIAQYNARAKEANEPELAEDAFETIASVFEQYMADKVSARPKLWFLTRTANVSQDLHDSIPPFEDFSWAPPNDQLKEVARAVYPHWSRRRAQRQGKPVMPALKFEEVAPHEADPYICFRRREVKALRKTRRTDALSLEKLKRLRAEMDTARILLEQVAKRERMRRESLALEHVIFDQQCALRGLRQALGLKEDVAGSSDQNAAAAAAAAAGSAAAPAALLKRRKKDAGAAGGTTVALRPLSRSGTGAQAAAGAPKISSPYEQLLLKKREADAPFEDVTFVSVSKKFFSREPREFFFFFFFFFFFHLSGDVRQTTTKKSK
ncbi:MAG: enhancer of polycomb-like-domain-containing protein [Olpidium bornovanus]|uniref:Enhancer of polycomb-like protein n=1 Tax=Olpidium bornovanus TaxID=278681 RepID=A0A8H8A193_9FUNG|nr:MAG: enhancer of polycomb-like-domain-containing protein [Olpidium bornovanus]